MSIREYIGARYVPIFGRKDEASIDWDDTKPYEPLTIVLYQGNSYTSRQYVPAGIPITNNAYWAITGNYNAQIEAYRNEVQTFDGRITANADDIDTLQGDMTTLQDNVDHVLDTDIPNIQATVDNITDTELPAIKGDINSLESFTDNLSTNDYINPLHVGIVRVAVNTYNQSAENTINWGQGLCVHDGKISQVIADTAGGATAHIYDRLITDTSFNTAKSSQIYHGNSLVYIPSINKYIASFNQGGQIAVCNAITYAVESIHVVGTDAILLAYDKVTNTLYGSDSATNLFILDPNTFQKTELPAWSQGFPYISAAQQDIAAYNGILYIMYSDMGKIVRYRISDRKFVSVVTMPNRTPFYYIGELEGIDVDENGVIYFSSLNYNTLMLAYRYTHIWKIDLANPTGVTGQWVSQTSGRSVSVVPPTSANLLGNQNPTGSGAAPFVTIAEAMDFLAMNQQYNTVSIDGDHSSERWQIDIPNIFIQGASSSTCKTGTIQFTGAKLAVQGVNIAPKESFTAHISGYRNGLIQFNPSTMAFTGTGTSGHKVQGTGQIISNFTAQTWD